MTGVSARVVALLAIAVFVNYVDRGNLATAGPLIRDQFGLSNAQFGVLLSAFFWSYALGQVPAGWLAERLHARKVLAVGLAIWGIATVLTGLAGGFLMLLVLRVMLGIGESVMYPASFKILAQEALESQRGRANGFLAAGLFAGPAVGTLAGGLLMVRFGWRVAFVVLGCASLVWLWPWLTTPAPKNLYQSVRAKEGPPSSMILRRRELWGSSLAKFCSAYTLYLVLSWLPIYLVKARGFSMAQMAQLGAGVWAFAVLVSVLTGWLSDRWLAAGASANRVRMTALMGGYVVAAVSIGACAWAGPVGAIIAMTGCVTGLGILFPAFYASTQTLAGPEACGRWMGAESFLTNFAGILAPVVTGVVVDRTGSFSIAFLIAAVLTACGTICYGLIVRRIEPVVWYPTISVNPAAAESLISGAS
jgi:MFS family permease